MARSVLVIRWKPHLIACETIPQLNDGNFSGWYGHGGKGDDEKESGNEKGLKKSLGEENRG